MLPTVVSKAVKFTVSGFTSNKNILHKAVIEFMKKDEGSFNIFGPMGQMKITDRNNTGPQ